MDKLLKNVRETTEDDEHTGQPVTATNDRKVAENQLSYILKDRRVTVEMLRYNLPFLMVQLRDIMTNKLGIRRVSARWVTC